MPALRQKADIRSKSAFDPKRTFRPTPRRLLRPQQIAQ